jgi:AcrR family transcriptional regulator
MTTIRTDAGTPPPRPPAESVATILEAARDLLADGGIEALSMRSVADRVGLSATAIYHHFQGKDDLIAQVVKLGYLRFGEYLEDAVSREPEGSVERLLAMAEAYVRFAFENKEYFRVLYSIQARIPRDLEELPGGGGYHLLRKCVVDAMDAGAMKEGNPDLVAHYLWTCVHGMVTLALACNIEAPGCSVGSGGVSAVELFRSFTPFIRDGLCGPGPENGA